MKNDVLSRWGIAISVGFALACACASGMADRGEPASPEVARVSDAGPGEPVPEPPLPPVETDATLPDARRVAVGTGSVQR